MSVWSVRARTSAASLQTDPIRLRVIAATIPAVRYAGQEYVRIRNTGSVAIPLGGMRLRDKSGQTLVLPKRKLGQGKSLDVYTGAGSSTRSSLFLGASPNTNLWSRHDTVRLVSAARQVIAKKAY